MPLKSVNLFGLILGLEVRESRTLYAYIYIFCVVVSFTHFGKLYDIPKSNNLRQLYSFKYSYQILII